MLAGLGACGLAGLVTFALVRSLQGTSTAPIVFVSAASAWEAAIKIALGRLILPEPFGHGVDHSGFRRLAIAFEHAQAAAELPRHHGDPFDRMLVAQTQLEGCTLVTHDEALAPYGVATLWT